MVSTTNSTSANETEFATLFTRTRSIGELWRDKVHVQTKQTVNSHMIDEPQLKGINSEESMADSALVGGPGYSAPAHKDVFHFVEMASRDKRTRS